MAKYELFGSEGNLIESREMPDAPVPQTISPRQIRQALTKYGYRTAVESAITATTDQDLKDWWHYATEFDRNHPQVQALATSLGYTAAQIDQVWIYGASI